MKSIIITSLSIIILSLTSCAKKINPIDGYQQIKNRKTSDILADNLTEKSKIEANTSYKNILTLNDPVLYYLDTVSSNYQKFSITLKPNKNYKIKVSSLCDCAGFKKYIFIPQVFPEKRASETLMTKPDSIYFNYEKGPLTLNKTWKIDTDNLNLETQFDFFVFSDNTKLGKKIHKFTTSSIGVANNIIIPVIAPINIKSTLVGKFYLMVEEK